jgi:hypothetical protein
LKHRVIGGNQLTKVVGKEEKRYIALASIDAWLIKTIIGSAVLVLWRG